MSKKTYIYTVTTMDNLEPRNCIRIPVAFSTMGDAMLCIEENWCDIFETSYDYAIIEKIRLNMIYPQTDKGFEEYWYKWEGDYETGNYNPISKPAELKNVLGFSIG